jgi:predicted lipoprotein with Yx(FWY)xxD motif
MRSRNLAALALALAGSGALAACGSTGGYGTGAAAAPTSTAAPAPTSTTAAPAPSAAPTTTAAASAAGATVAVAHTSLGDVLVDANGHTLYAFTNDTNGTSSCSGSCSTAWPPLVVTADVKAGTGVQSANLHTITRSDGHVQVVDGKWPLYTYADDEKPGDVNGQGVAGKWFVVHPDGTLLKTTH